MNTKNEIILKGLPISDGISIGKPYLFLKDENPVPDFDISKEDIQSEIKRYREAINEFSRIINESDESCGRRK